MKNNELSIVGKIIVAVLLGLLVIFSITAAIGIYFLGIVGFFNVFGVEYHSIGSLFLFVVYVFLVSLLTDLLAKVTYKLSSTYISGKYKLIAARLLYEVLFAWIALYTVDEIMDTITIPFLIEATLAFLLAATEFVFGTNKREELQ